MLLSCVKLVFVMIAFRTTRGQEEGGWDYEKSRGALDPGHWYLKYENCAGKRQSPIAVDCDHIMEDLALEPLWFTNYSRPIKSMRVHNDGHTIKVEVPESSGLHLRSATLPASYRLTQFHFHWGTSTQGGSEHKINGRRWPLEVHFVHVDEDIPINQTQIDKNGLVVVSVLFDYQVAGDDSKPLDAITKVASAVAQVLKEDDHVELKDFAISDLMPVDEISANYLRYAGSLTTPPCAEVVEWIILTRTMAVTPDILSLFRSTRHRIHALAKNADAPESEVKINENDRPLQPLNDRPIRLKGDLGDLPQCANLQ